MIRVLYYIYKFVFDGHGLIYSNPSWARTQFFPANNDGTN